MELDLIDSPFKNKVEFINALHKWDDSILDVSAHKGYDCYNTVSNKVPGLFADDYGSINDPQPIGYVGVCPKMYGLKYSDESDKSAMKGVSVKNDKKADGSCINYDDYAKLLDGRYEETIVEHTGIKFDKLEIGRASCRERV